VPPRVTLQTVADRLGVSRMTVSNAFSRPDQLSDAMRRKVLAAADELGYAGPDPSARALARGRTGAVGVMLTDRLEYAFTDQLATDFMGAVTAGLAPTGLALTLLTSSGRDDFLPSRDVPLDGAIVYACTTSSHAVDWLQRRKLPVVFVDQEPVDGVACINIDDRGGARQAAQHLVDLGHRQIGVITTIRDVDAGMLDVQTVTAAAFNLRERMLGWLEALSPVGVEPLIVNAGMPSESDGADALQRLLAAAPETTAVLCFSDTIAAQALDHAHAIGRGVPDSLSIVGFDDTRFARTLNPPLTTVSQDIDAKGRAAANALTAAIAGSTDAPHILIPTQLVIRQSTAPPA
jgi:DNA-binding LacI/PurR family transcriptional regulator